jgi:hypothetical protein
MSYGAARFEDGTSAFRWCATAKKYGRSSDFDNALRSCRSCLETRRAKHGESAAQHAVLESLALAPDQPFPDEPIPEPVPVWDSTPASATSDWGLSMAADLHNVGVAFPCVADGLSARGDPAVTPAPSLHVSGAVSTLFSRGAPAAGFRLPSKPEGATVGWGSAVADRLALSPTGAVLPAVSPEVVDPTNLLIAGRADTDPAVHALSASKILRHMSLDMCRALASRASASRRLDPSHAGVVETCHEFLQRGVTATMALSLPVTAVLHGDRVAYVGGPAGQPGVPSREVLRQHATQLARVMLSLMDPEGDGDNGIPTCADEVTLNTVFQVCLRMVLEKPGPNAPSLACIAVASQYLCVSEVDGGDALDVGPIGVAVNVTSGVLAAIKASIALRLGMGDCEERLANAFVVGGVGLVAFSGPADLVQAQSVFKRVQIGQTQANRSTVGHTLSTYSGDRGGIPCELSTGTSISLFVDDLGLLAAGAVQTYIKAIEAVLVKTVGLVDPSILNAIYGAMTMRPSVHVTGHNGEGRIVFTIRTPQGTWTCDKLAEVFADAIFGGTSQAKRRPIADSVDSLLDEAAAGVYNLMRCMDPTSGRSVELSRIAISAVGAGKPPAPLVHPSTNDSPGPLGLGRALVFQHAHKSTGTGKDAIPHIVHELPVLLLLLLTGVFRAAFYNQEGWTGVAGASTVTRAFTYRRKEWNPNRGATVYVSLPPLACKQTMG